MNLKRWLSLLIFLTSLITISVIIHSNGLKLFLPVKATTFERTVPRRWQSVGSDELGPSVPWRYKNSTTEPGYILVAQYADQMTGASFSILSLQCWAGAINPSLKVVEPFLYTGSGFGYTFNSRKGVKHHSHILKSNNQVKLGDIFNLKKWHKQLESTGTGNSHAMLESWEVFKKSAPKNLIIVGRDCSITELSTCNNKFYKSVRSFAAKKGFRIVRKVEIERKRYSFNDFANHIYGPLDPSEVVVFFRQWGGIVTKAFDRRYTISGIDQCLREQYRDFLFETSDKVHRDSSKYTSSYLSGTGKTYISVMLRFERFGLQHFRGANSQDEKMAAFAKCQQAIEREVRNMQAIHNMSGLFLAMDARKHGSRGLRNSSPSAYMDNALLDTITRQMFDALRPYGNVIATVEEWEASFDNISSISAPGYVAQMQKNLAASGMCLVTAGGGSFQKSARLLYMSMHTETQRRCVIDVMECS